MSECCCCCSAVTSEIYNAGTVPVFQNLNYLTADEAKNIVRGSLRLCRCQRCGFTYNADFIPEKMHYDQRYVNEQSNSPIFQQHLDDMTALLAAGKYASQNVIEIGCGQGIFLERLHNAGFSVSGYDPAYTGSASYIHKEYFTPQTGEEKIGLIILRHVLEHIPAPRDFLSKLAEILNPDCQIYIEVPDFDWILEHNAFWDIHYEHCNYFTAGAFSALFSAGKSKNCFGGQYRYLRAKLEDLSRTLSQDRFNQEDSASIPAAETILQQRITEYQRFIPAHTGIFLWGGGAKATTFLNVTDPDCRYVKGVVDINPSKQQKFIAGSGHAIISPQEMLMRDCTEVLIMNDNYEQEIRKLLPARIKVYTLK